MEVRVERKNGIALLLLSAVCVKTYFEVDVRDVCNVI